MSCSRLARGSGRSGGRLYRSRAAVGRAGRRKAGVAGAANSADRDSRGGAGGGSDVAQCWSAEVAAGRSREQRVESRESRVEERESVSIPLLSTPALPHYNARQFASQKAQVVRPGLASDLINELLNIGVFGQFIDEFVDALLEPLLFQVVLDVFLNLFELLMAGPSPVEHANDLDRVPGFNRLTDLSNRLFEQGRLDFLRLEAPLRRPSPEAAFRFG